MSLIFYLVFLTIFISHYLCKKLALKNKKKEHIIWDEAKEEYIAKLIPYASRVSGPLIEVPNVDAFKKKA